MDDRQSAEHWQPGQPWKPRDPDAPDERSEAKPSAGEVPVVRAPVTDESTDVVEETSAMDTEQRYRDAQTRMMTAPPEPAPPAPEPAPPASEPAPPAPRPQPADRTVMMPAVGGGATLPPPASATQRAAAPTQPPAAPPAPRDDRKRGKRRFGFFRRLLVLIVVLAAIAALGFAWVESQLVRVPTPSATGGPGPETFLIVGSDSRENLPDDLDGRFGSFAGQRADVIILAHVSGGTVQMLSLPRDLKVDIPGHGTEKINAAYAFGGGDLLVQTIQQDLQIPIDRYLEVEFGGFASIVDAVGGVELTFDHPTRDLKTGLEVDAGTRVVDGSTALSYVRSRSTEEFRDGDWRNADGGDIARTGRQREVLEGVLSKALSPAGIIRVPALVPALTSAIRVGDSTHSWNLGLFGARYVLASESESMALPVVISSEGGVSYVVRTDEAGPAIDAFRSGTPLPLPDVESD